ncbi:MAG: hypothetical protein GC179_04765 [Anaerolineaceae bacterium]|nr:hypothetical protein [Anaerolineaceae bacterium]
MKGSTDFQRFGGLCAILAGIFGFSYALAFIVVARSNTQLGGLLASLFLLLGGLSTMVALIALFQRVQSADEGFASWGRALAITGAVGSIIHGGYDLANAVHVPESDPLNLANLPNAVDPRGLLTFGVAGVGLIIAARLMVRSKNLPNNLGYLGYVLGIVLVVIYLARLIILDATNPVVVITVVITGFVLNPVWNIWLGISLRRIPQTA